MNMIDRLGGACVLLALAGGAAPLSAQEAMPAPVEEAADTNRDPRAVEILQSAQTAIAETSTLVYSVVKTMEKTEELAPENAMFASISIGAKGTVRAAKDDEGRWVYTIDGTSDDIGRKDAFEIVIQRGPQTVSWLDEESTTLVTANRNLARGRAISTESEFGVHYVFGKPFEKPFEEILEAPTLEVLEPEIIDGVMCDVVRARYGRNNESGDKIVYVSSVDGLPRLVRDVLVTGFENRTAYSFETPDEAPTVESLAIEAPAGWETAYRPESLRPDFVSPQARPLDAAVEGDGSVGFLVGDRAPAFVGQTMLGDEVSSASIAGKPAVLLFWASWIPGADELVEFLADTQQSRDDVELVTFAVRERNPDAAFNLLAGSGLDTVPLLINARDAVLAFGVTRAPLVLVIDAEGVIRFRSEAGNELEGVFEEANKVLDALNNGE
ncbi:MAG: TlpA disulfide reductase family protein [Planctomycetota bacterium]